MNDLKISIITVVYNARETIGKCIRSVISQSYNAVEYIIIDGGSSDGTLELISQFNTDIAVFISEKDNGIYDAMNKGIRAATGDVVGILNADDFFANDQILAKVADAFKLNDVDILYGNLKYVDRLGKTVRQWNAGKYKQGLFNWGWMPPHPTLYCRRGLFETSGYYSMEYGSAGDYELMLRVMHRNKTRVFYLNTTMVCMLIGGVSNKSIRNRVKVAGFDLKAMQKNGVRFPIIAILIKPLRKINQFFNN